MINRGDSIGDEPEAWVTYERVASHDLLLAFISVVCDGNVRGHRDPLFSPLSSTIYLFIYLRAPSFYPRYHPTIMDNKTFHALKSNNQTRTRVSQKVGWLAKTMRGFTFFPSLSLFFSFSLSLSTSASRPLYFYHPLGTTSIERPMQKDSKRKKREERRAETKTGTRWRSGREWK